MSYKEHKEGKYTVQKYYSGSKFWLLDDEYHREDGPAIERYDGSKEWWLNNTLVYSDYVNKLKNYPDLTEEFKRSVIIYELQRK